MLAPHTDSLSCGLLASGNVAAHHFEVEGDMKGLGRNGKRASGGMRLGMAGTPHVHQQDIRCIIITFDRNRWKTPSLKSIRIDKICIFILLAWKHECIIQDKTENMQNDIQEKVHILKARNFPTEEQCSISQKSCDCCIHTPHSPFWRVSWFGPDVILTHPFVLKLSSACGASIPSSPSSKSAAGEGGFNRRAFTLLC